MVGWWSLAAEPVGTGLASSIWQCLTETVIRLRGSSTIHTWWVLVVGMHLIVSRPVASTGIGVTVEGTVSTGITLFVGVVNLTIIVGLLLRVLRSPVRHSVVSWVISGSVSAVLVVVISPARTVVVRYSTVLFRRVSPLVPGVSGVIPR